MKKRTDFIALRVRPEERALLFREAKKRGYHSISNLIREALDALLGTGMNVGDLSFAEDRPRVPCQKCYKPVTHRFGPERYCGHCYREAHPEKFAHTGRQGPRQAIT